MVKRLLLFFLAAILILTATGCRSEAEPTAEPTAGPSEPTVTSPQPTQSPLPGPASPLPVPESPLGTPGASDMEILSRAFDPGGEIPERYSCFGENVSPPVEWTGVPEDAQSLVLIVTDPDSQPSGFVHWIAYNVQPYANGLPEDVPGGAEVDMGFSQGSNDFAPYGEGTFPGGAEIKRVGYDGPCPPSAHRYVFTLYALNAALDLPAEPTAEQVMAAMEGHVLARAELMGTYAPPR